MKLTNEEILLYSNRLMNIFEKDDNKKYMPVRIGFAIQKNFSTLLTLAKEIETSRMKICEEYGKVENGNDYYTFSPDVIDIVNEEFNDLFTIEQDVNIKMVNLKDIEKLELTMLQIEALMFMIEE